MGKVCSDIARWGAIILLVSALFGIGGCGGGDTGDSAGAGGQVGTTRSGEDDSTEGDGVTPGGPPTIQMSGGMTAPNMGGTMMGGPMGMGPMGGGGPVAGGPGGQTPQGAGPQVTTKPPNARPDPFAPWWSTTPPPPAAITLVEPYRIATRETGIRPPEEKVEVQEVPNRRVAGIATGAGVYALVEGPEGQTVVKAGDMLGDYRVEAIRARSIVLVRKVGNVSYTQEVPLTDVGSQRPAYGGGPVGGPGGAGMMFRGGGAPPMGGGGGGNVGAETEM
ncbi:MAG: hypothetical protein GX446_07645 [Chthonomonadales bacterium]|nr:hypothetical protein [Chthonomonadales bacterium]